MAIVVRNKGARFLWAWLPATAFWLAVVWGLVEVPELRHPLMWAFALLLAWPVAAGAWIMLFRRARVIVDDRGITERFWGLRHVPWEQIAGARIAWTPDQSLPMDLCLSVRKPGAATTVEIKLRLLGTDADANELLAAVRARLLERAPAP